MKTSIIKHVKSCNICQKCNLQVVPYAKLHFDTATFPMEFISMDLIEELYPPCWSQICPYSDLHANQLCFLHTPEDKTGQ